MLQPFKSRFYMLTFSKQRQQKAVSPLETHWRYGFLALFFCKRLAHKALGIHYTAYVRTLAHKLLSGICRNLEVKHTLFYAPISSIKNASRWSDALPVCRARLPGLIRTTYAMAILTYPSPACQVFFLILPGFFALFPFFFSPFPCVFSLHMRAERARFA